MDLFYLPAPIHNCCPTRGGRAGLGSDSSLRAADLVNTSVSSLHLFNQPNPKLPLGWFPRGFSKSMEEFSSEEEN